MARPSLFCQNPMVSAPVLQFFTDALALFPVATIVVVLLTVVRPLAGGALETGHTSNEPTEDMP
jgi:hypothetical protein